MGRRLGRACSIQEKARLESECKARAECTSNISSMVVTWDVSKFSGWLNTFANCRVKKGGEYNIEGPWGDAGCKARVECTLNIATMRVTRDVSKFNGWLNAFAPCHQEGGWGAESRGVGAAGRPRMSSVHGQARLESLCRAYVECTLNIPSIFVTRDVSKFSGWLNAFATCRVKRGAYKTGRSVGRCSLELTLNSGRHDWSLSA